MIDIPGFEIKNEIYSSVNSQIFEGIELSSKNKVIFKILQDSQRQSPDKVRKFLLEYQILKKFHHPGIVKPIQLIESDSNPILIIEYGGTSLRNLISQRKFFIEELIHISLKASEILSEIHSNKIIHKDINPGNILYDPDTKQVKIIDFGISSILSKEKEILKNPNVIEGTLSYISPEQSGRMNRIIDFRTDFYSLGITFFEIFSGKLPFRSKDSMELIHQHLTTPTPSLEGQIPEFMDRIIQKLTSKNAEDRYQSGFGLKKDLEICFDFFKRSKGTQNFILGQSDLNSELNIPQKLYGRETQVPEILQIFKRASEGAVELVLVSGYSGTGKSALVQELYKPITKLNGYFISGKFDQLQRDIPYSALVHAFQELVAQIMTEPNDKIHYWKDSFLKALIPNAQVIIDVIPELEKIIGQQPPVQSLEPKEAQNRFNLYFEKFIQVILKKEHPLVIFLDDLQWADGASLRFMQNLLLARNIQHMLFIGAYRDNEVYQGHPSMIMISEIEKANIPIHNFLMEPLKKENVIQLLTDTFQNTKSDRGDLAELLLAKTEGNPFFLRELLKSLYAEEEIQFLHNEGIWNWDIKKIANRGITNNVVELMTERLRKLSKDTQNALKYAACIGAEFDVQTLSIISKTSVFSLAQALLEAIQAGLILSHSNDHKFLLLEEEFGEGINIFYKFIHDRIQQAAYLLIPDEEKLEFHLQIGEIYISKLSKEELEIRIFDVVGHLNKARPIFTEENKLVSLAEYNLLAGVRAKKSAAYEPSFNYLKIALETLGDNSWVSHYQLTYNIYLEMIESAYLSGFFPEMKNLVAIAKVKALNNHEKVDIMLYEMSGIMAQGQMNEVILLSIEALKLLNIHYDPNPSKLKILSNYFYLQISSRKSIKEVLSKGNCKDSRIIQIISVMYFVAGPAVVSNPNFAFYIILKAIMFFIRYGFSKFTSNTVAAYSFLLSAYLNNFEASKYFAQIAEELEVDSSLKCRTVYALSAGVRHWFYPFPIVHKELYENYFFGIENGDLEYASNSFSIYTTIKLITGCPLKELEIQISEVYEGIIRLGQIPAIRWINCYLHFINNICYSNQIRIDLNGKFFEEKEIIEESERTVDNSGLFNIYLLKCISAYIYIEEDKQFEFTEKLAKIFVFVPGSITTSYFVFLDSVILMSLLIKQKIPKSYFKRVKSNLKKLKKWAKYSAHNRLHHTYFIEALIFEYKGKTTEALDSFEKSIQKSHDIGFLMDEAIFAERAGRFCLSKNKKEIGIYFLSNAKNKYLRWGAQLKVNLLDREFPFLQTSSNHNTTISTHITTVLDKTHQEQTNFDLNTVQKFSRVISGEIEIEKLLSKVLHMILQNSGADFACILLEENNNLNIEAQMGIDGIIHFSKKNLDESKTDLPQSIIRTVFNRNEPVLLNQATIEGSFTEDPFIQSNKILSLLCVPINNQGKTIGILYLHNQIVKGVFNRNRIEILDMIISQSAISIANAKLYNTLEQKVQLRTLELESTNQKLKNLNQETANLNQLLNSLNKELDLKEILEKIYQYISSRYQLKYYALYLISPDQKYIKVKYWNFYKDVPNEFLEDFQNQQIGVIGTKGAHALAIHSRDAKVFHHIRLTGITPEERRNIDFFNIKTFLTIPIYLENKPLGMLDFFSEAKLKISKSDLSSISILGKQLSGIINNAKLYEETIQAKREIEQANFELKSTQEALSRAERSASINSMVSHLAHEVNNPLNYISTGEMITKESVQDAKAFILAAIPESPESKPFVEKIHSLFGEIDLGIKQTEKGRSRIKDTIQEIRAITGVDGIHVDNIDLIPILYSNWELTCEKNQIQAGLVSLVVNGVVWPQKFIQPTVVLSQKYIFSRAIRTLLNNSIYFAKMNPNPKIQIDLQKIQSSQENFISISIRNNGPSIEDGKESKIFDLKSSKYFGTELIGLPFVKEILQSVQCNLSLTDNGRNSGWVEFQIVMKDFV